MFQSIIQPTIYSLFFYSEHVYLKVMMQDNRHGQRPLFENNFVADITGTIHVGDDIIVVNVLP
jgi:hypothetical protein